MIHRCVTPTGLELVVKTRLGLNKSTLLFYSVCVSLCMYAMCSVGAPGVQKRALAPLEQEVQAVVSPQN